MDVASSLRNTGYRRTLASTLRESNFAVSIYAPFRILFAAAAALLIATLIASSSAHAMLLGDAVQQSGLGAPLRVVIPIKPARGEALDSACFRIVANAAGAGAPIVTAKVTLERAAATPRLVVTTPSAINEPAVQFTIQAGCDGTTRRNYVLLLDPPAAGAIAVSHAHPINSREPGQERLKAAPSSMRRGMDAAAQRASPPPDAAGATAAVVAPAGRDLAAAAATAAMPAGFREAAAQAPALMAKPQRAMPHAAAVEANYYDKLWWYLAASMIVIGALALGTFFVRRRRALTEIPEWTRGAAYNGPRSVTDLSAAPVTLSHSDVTVQPSISSGTKPRSVAPSLLTVDVSASPSLNRRRHDPDISALDTLISDISEADLVEERAVREAWAAARSDVEREADGNAVLRAIEAAERDLLFAAPPPAQAAMDRSLDDDLLASPKRPRKAAA
jgi:hypothetical protein